MDFWTYRPPKTWLDKCLKSPVSKDRLTSNMVSGLKRYWNLNGIIFTRFIGHCESNLVVKSLCWWYAKYSDYFLTHWLPKTSILFLIDTIYCNILRWNYIRKKNLFLNFLSNFQNLDSLLTIFKKKMIFIVDVFLKLRTPQNLLDKYLKGPISEDPSRSNMENGPKCWWNLNESTFTRFIDQCERKSLGKSFS